MSEYTRKKDTMVCWEDPRLLMIDSSHGTVTYRQWCDAEVERLAAYGVTAKVVWNTLDQCAVMVD